MFDPDHARTEDTTFSSLFIGLPGGDLKRGRPLGVEERDTWRRRVHGQLSPRRSYVPQWAALE
jgi:hypothetical protein